MSRIDDLEREVMNRLLDGEDEVLAVLREQYEGVRVRKREMTGAGSFTYFAVRDDAPRALKGKTFSFGDVAAQVPQLQNGIGYALFVQDGALDMLEAYTFDERWPRRVQDFQVVYRGRQGRDLAALRQRWI